MLSLFLALALVQDAKPGRDLPISGAAGMFKDCVDARVAAAGSAASPEATVDAAIRACEPQRKRLDDTVEMMLGMVPPDMRPNLRQRYADAVAKGRRDMIAEVAAKRGGGAAAKR